LYCTLCLKINWMWNAHNYFLMLHFKFKYANL
jgi:hypothetical protein